MVSYYTVVQYYPDPIAGERINIGVIAFGDGRLRSRFLENWRRVEQFGSEDISYLHDFARRAEAWDEATLKDCMAWWKRSIQFREPLPSLLDPEKLLDEVVRLFLREPTDRLPSDSASANESDGHLVAAS
jgi:hypothetical protein